MKRTIITTLAAAAAVFAAAYLTGADGTTSGGHAGATGMQATPQQPMQEPMVETEECEGYILLMPCPVCHTCPVCQANCGTAHALRCCVGNRKPATGTQTGTMPATGQRHIMTNKAEAVKHAAGRTAPSPQIEGGEISVLTIEAD